MLFWLKGRLETLDKMSKRPHPSSRDSRRGSSSSDSHTGSETSSHSRRQNNSNAQHRAREERVRLPPLTEVSLLSPFGLSLRPSLIIVRAYLNSARIDRLSRRLAADRRRKPVPFLRTALNPSPHEMTTAGQVGSTRSLTVTVAGPLRWPSTLGHHPGLMDR